MTAFGKNIVSHDHSFDWNNKINITIDGVSLELEFECTRSRCEKTYRQGYELNIDDNTWSEIKRYIPEGLKLGDKKYHLSSGDNIFENVKILLSDNLDELEKQLDTGSVERIEIELDDRTETIETEYISSEDSFRRNN